MTTHPDHADDAGQCDLFGNPISSTATAPPVSRMESNDVELMVIVAANAARCGYLLVGAAERVYTRTQADDRVARVPRYEEDAVHQLLRRRWLTLGSAHRVTCGAAQLVGTAVLVPKATRERIERWNRLQRPHSWPTQHGTASGIGSGNGHGDTQGRRLVRLDDYRSTP
jgi:hypothetical protein